MDETTKAKQYWGPIEQQATRGKGIDIGCGPDPVTEHAVRFDREHGDANCVTQFIHEQFDFVYSSHCLEHMHDATSTILDWWKMVKPDGFLFVSVPDEDLYEQGVFPSRFNPDHKATFTLSKAKSWSSKSINVLDLAKSLPNGEIVSVELQDRGYDRSLLTFGARRKSLTIKALSWISEKLGLRDRPSIRRILAPYYGIDQTTTGYNAQAQIQLIVRKLA
jgi:SAM-dependent methyltransferase